MTKQKRKKPKRKVTPRASQSCSAQPKLSREDLNKIVDHLQGELKSREKRIAKLEGQVASQQVVADVISKTAPAITARAPQKFAVHKRRTTVSAVSQLGDWHIGSVILKSEVGNMPPYNYAIAERRMDQYTRSVAKWLLNRRDVFNLRELVVMGMADWILGTIHPEYLDSAEFAWPEQCIRAGTLIAESITALRNYTGLPIRFVFLLCDNHGRDSAKPRSKRKADHSMNIFVRDRAMAMLRDMPDLTWETGPGIKILTRVEGLGFIVTHGDTIRSGNYAGLPYYGIFREFHKEAARRIKDPSWDFKYLTLGHFHHHFVLGQIIGNGSLQGTDEYDESCGRTSTATQNAFLVNPRRGIFDMTAFDLE